MGLGAFYLHEIWRKIAQIAITVSENTASVNRLYYGVQQAS